MRFHHFVLSILVFHTIASSASAAQCTRKLSNSTKYPYVIDTSNSYVCVTTDITKKIAPAAKLIIIDADNVTLDLQGHQLKNSPVSGKPDDSEANTYGVYASGIRKNITVKNGRINGFNGGVFIEDTGTGYATDSVVENLAIVNFTGNGIRMDGTGTIKNNKLEANNAGDFGIVAQSAGIRIINNDISYPTAFGISVGSPASGTSTNSTVIEGNTLLGSSSSATAIEGQNLAVAKNRVTKFAPLDLDGSCKLLDNVIEP